MVKDRPNVYRDTVYNVNEVCSILDIDRQVVIECTEQEIIVPFISNKRELYYLGSEINHLYEHLSTHQKK